MAMKDVLKPKPIEEIISELRVKNKAGVIRLFNRSFEMYEWQVIKLLIEYTDHFSIDDVFNKLNLMSCHDQYISLKSAFEKGSLWGVSVLLKHGKILDYLNSLKPLIIRGIKTDQTEFFDLFFQKGILTEDN